MLFGGCIAEILLIVFELPHFVRIVNGKEIAARAIRPFQFARVGTETILNSLRENAFHIQTGR